MSEGGGGRPKSRRHHTVPRFYLRRFADDKGQLLRVALPGDHRHRVSVNDATVENDFYIAELDDGSQTDLVEAMFSEIEGHAAHAFRAILDRGEWPPSADTRAGIAAWAALQILRSPAVRRQGEDIADVMLKLQIAAGGKPAMRENLRELHGREPTDAEVDEAWADASDFDNWRLPLHPNAHIKLIGEMLPGTVSQFFARGWTITRFERKTLLTSDSPIYLAPHPDQPAGMGTGLVTAGGILMTLDRRTALLMNDVGDQDLVMPPAAAYARSVNGAVAFNARRAIFHHPDDDPLAGLPPLPQPRENEVGVGDALERFTFPEGMPMPVEGHYPAFEEDDDDRLL